ncbi:MAG: BadF/BadG/BcrA/BcrD ATPase family protein [candidate division WOR-3 bacterium]
MKVLGVDVGGSYTKFVIWDGERVLKRGRLKWNYGSDWNDLKILVDKLMEDFDVHYVGFAIRGVWTKGEKKKLEKVLNGKVISDVEGVFFDAFGYDEGMVLIAGTGSICLAKKGNKTFRYGGYGYLFSDWGSAFWIGKMAVELLLKKESFLRMAIFRTEDLEKIRLKVKRIMELDRGKMIKRVASFSKIVLKVAEIGDEDANYLVNSAIRELLGMCIKVYDISGVSSLALHGGLFKSKLIRDRFLNLAKRYNFDIKGYGFDGALGVAKFIMASGGLK